MRNRKRAELEGHFVGPVGIRKEEFKRDSQPALGERNSKGQYALGKRICRSSWSCEKWIWKGLQALREISFRKRAGPGGIPN